MIEYRADDRGVLVPFAVADYELEHRASQVVGTGDDDHVVQLAKIIAKIRKHKASGVPQALAEQRAGTSIEAIVAEASEMVQNGEASTLAQALAQLLEEEAGDAFGTTSDKRWDEGDAWDEWERGERVTTKYGLGSLRAPDEGLLPAGNIPPRRPLASVSPAATDVIWSISPAPGRTA